ncbi:MAG TPA: GTPase Era [Rubricoccaceae bacterium]|jgi:GTP-binding protein Era
MPPPAPLHDDDPDAPEGDGGAHGPDDGPLDPSEFFADDDDDARAPGLLMGGAVPEGHRSGYVAIIGAPNVGKSTLLNRLLGTKLSIVSPRPSTTRNRVLGILSFEGAPATDDGPALPAHQLVLLDTPGVVRPKYRLHDHMMRDVDRSIGDADVVVLLADALAPRITHDAQTALERAARQNAPVLLAINKTDGLRSSADALPLVDLYAEGFGRAFDEVVPVSALTGKGVDTLLRLVLDRVPEGPPYYPPDQLSEHPERFFLGEIVREAIFHLYRDEVPYSTQAVVVTVEERPGQKTLVAVDVVVERDSQKAILVGKGGSAMKRLGTAARQEMEAFLGRGVFLKLFVKTRADWRDREGYLREYGFGK